MRGRPDVAIVDLREKSERERHGSIPGSLHAPYPELQENIGEGGMLHELAEATGKRIVFYCAFGERSAMAVQAAQDAGLKTACHIEGGIDAWKKANGPSGSKLGGSGVHETVMKNANGFHEARSEMNGESQGPKLCSSWTFVLVQNIHRGQAYGVADRTPSRARASERFGRKP